MKDKLAREAVRELADLMDVDLEFLSSDLHLYERNKLAKGCEKMNRSVDSKHLRELREVFCALLDYLNIEYINSKEFRKKKIIK